MLHVFRIRFIGYQAHIPITHHIFPNNHFLNCYHPSLYTISLNTLSILTISYLLIRSPSLPYDVHYHHHPSSSSTNSFQTNSLHCLSIIFSMVNNSCHSSLSIYSHLHSLHHHHHYRHHHFTSRISK